MSLVHQETIGCLKSLKTPWQECGKNKRTLHLKDKQIYTVDSIYGSKCRLIRKDVCREYFSVQRHKT